MRMDNVDFIFCLGVTVGLAQGLFLALSCESPGRGKETIWVADDWTQVSHIKGKHPIHCSISPILDILDFKLFTDKFKR